MSYSPFIEPLKSQFGEQLFSEQTQIINLKSIYGISLLRDVLSEVGGGIVGNVGGEYKLSTTASSGDVARLESAERGRYIAGQDSIVGLGVRVADTPTGEQDAKWGYYDADDGFGFGVDATGSYVFRRKLGVDSKTYQSNWNADTVDGNGESGLTLDDSIGYVYQINFAWYGYGGIEYKILMFDSDMVQKVVTVHRDRVQSQTSLTDPNLPVSVEILNGATATAFDSVYVGGRQFSTRGKFTPSKRITSEARLSLGSVNTTFLPTISMRRKVGFESASVKTEAFDIITDAELWIEIRSGATLTGAVFNTPSNHNASETVLESDISATAVSGGNVIWAGLVDSSGLGSASSGSASVPVIQQDLVGTDPVTICVRRVAGTAATVSVVTRLVEEW